MQVLFGIAYFVLGLIQCAAIFSGMAEWTGLHWIISGPLALFVAYVPILGTVVGIFGAMSAWGWSLVQGVGLFLGPIALILVIGLIAAGLDGISSARSTR